ncbi:MAG: hypothetical protein LBV20_00620 [Treponema sp.]|jgi:hypothetical protein|nr:hypothetical protein [Treponema sp.]
MAVDWLPGKRGEQLAMARTWQRIMEQKGASWRCDAILPDFSGWVDDAENALRRCMDADRTRGDTASCNEAFKGLTGLMREIKKRYFFIPPLTAKDLVDLGLDLPESGSSPIAVPEGQVSASVQLVGPHVLRLIIEHVAGTPFDVKADYGCRIHWGIMPHGGATLEQAASQQRYLQKPPVSGDALPFNAFTKRKREMLNFSAEDSGKTVYFCLRYENSKGKVGPWGPLFSAIIP